MSDTADRSWFAPRDLPAMLWREGVLMAAVFALVLLLGLVLVLASPTRYMAHSSLLIRLGRSYIYQPAVGDAARGAAPDNDAVVQSELEILQSDAVKVRVVKDIGLERFGGAPRGEGAGDAKAFEAREQAAMKSVGARLKVQTAPGAAIARLTFVDKDPVMSAMVLNTLVDEYLNYRKSVLADNLRPINDQRRTVQQQLDAADQRYQDFLKANGVGDFDAEKASLAQIYAQLLADRYGVRAQLAEAEGRLSATSREMAGSKPEIGLYHDLDHAAQDKLAQLRVELQDLLARYQPTAQPVRDLEQKIAALQGLAAGAPMAGARRVGVNPVFQTLQTEKNQSEAQVASLRNRAAALDKEIADVTARRQRLTTLEPAYQALARDRELLTASVKSLAEREQEARAAQGVEADGGDDSVKVLERAYPAARGVSLKAPLAIGALAFAAFAALCAGLFRAFLRPGWPSAAAAGRASRLPVLAVLP